MMRIKQGSSKLATMCQRMREHVRVTAADFGSLFSPVLTGAQWSAFERGERFPTWRELRRAAAIANVTDVRPLLFQAAVESRVIELDGLSDRQIEALVDRVETFRRQNRERRAAERGEGRAA